MRAAPHLPSRPAHEPPECEDPAAPPERLERELADAEPAGEPRSPVERLVVPRWVQLVLLPLALVAMWGLAIAAGRVLLLFVIAGLIALILNPAVAFLYRRRLPRGLAVLSVYLGFFLTLAFVGILLASPISNQVSAFTRAVPHITAEANAKLASLQGTLTSDGLHVQLIKQGKTALGTLQGLVVKTGGSVVSFGGGLLTRTVSTGFDIVLIFVLSVYMLVYGPRIAAITRRAMPTGDGTPADDFPILVQRAVSHYVRGQLLFSVIMGTTSGLALYLFGLLGIFPDGRTYAVAFGAFFGLMELVPYIGPFLGALPPMLVALFTDPISALWVALLFVALQQLEGHLVAPQIFSHSLRINPLMVIGALLFGQQVEGIIGAVIALPLLAVARETVIYLQRHLTLEPWDRSPRTFL